LKEGEGIPVAGMRNNNLLLGCLSCISTGSMMNLPDPFIPPTHTR
jgi:hypothetical protein